MPATARSHFNDDIARAKTIYLEGVNHTSKIVAGDLFRSAIVLSVGAMDAYLCDAYVDCLTVALRVCRSQGKQLPSGYAKELLPAGPLISNSYTKRVNWSLRMAARSRMEKDNLLRVGRLRDMLNPSLPSGQKLWFDVVPKYVALNRKRLTGVSRRDFALLRGDKRKEAQKKAAAALLLRVGTIVQRRHDIVHNCDRPKLALQRLSRAATDKMISDIEGFVVILDEHLDAHRIF